MTPRVVVTGAGGLLGRELVRAFPGCDVVGLDHGRLDVTDRDAVLATVHDLRPDIVVNAAAWTAVDACEADPERAFVANALAVRWLADACARVGAHLVHVSTDYVFDGRLDRAYTEWDDPAPLSAYGRSKLAGEREAAAVGATIVRTSATFGARGRSIVSTILDLASEPDRSLVFVDDQRTRPTAAGELAAVIARLGGDRVPGVVHVAGATGVSWFELARAVLAAADLDPDRVRPVSTADLHPPRPAPRPANSELDGVVLRSLGIPGPGPLEPAIATVVSALRG